MNFLCLITLDFKNSTVADQSWNLRGTCPTWGYPQVIIIVFIYSYIYLLGGWGLEEGDRSPQGQHVLFFWVKISNMKIKGSLLPCNRQWILPSPQGKRRSKSGVSRDGIFAGGDISKKLISKW